MKNKLNTKAGFSLVELMVVVAIIGILASIAVPNFTKFQNKAKQSSAKTMLSAIYAAEQAFLAEQSQYHSNIVHIGVSPEGADLIATTNCPNPATGADRLYSVGFGDLSVANAVAANAPVGSAGTPACLGGGTGDARDGSSFLSARINGTTTGTAPSSAGDTATPAGAAISNAGVNSFTAFASGRIQTGGAVLDVWSMDHRKTLTNVTSGI